MIFFSVGVDSGPAPRRVRGRQTAPGEGRSAMTQYLLSVHLDEAAPAPSDEQMQQNYKAVDAFNAVLGRQRVGVRRRPEPAIHRVGGPRPGRAGRHHRRPVRRDQETARRFLDHQRGRPGQARSIGPRKAPRPAARRSRCGLSRRCRRTEEMPGPDAAALEHTFREISGRAVATLVRLFGDIDLAEEAVQEAFAVAAERWARGGGRGAGYRPTPVAGSSPPRGTRPWTAGLQTPRSPARCWPPRGPWPAAGPGLPGLQRGIHGDTRFGG